MTHAAIVGQIVAQAGESLHDLPQICRISASGIQAARHVRVPARAAQSVHFGGDEVNIAFIVVESFFFYVRQ